MHSLLPPNATKGEHAIEATTARIEDVPVPLRTLWNPATCPESLLPWLAWGLSIDAWKSYWPIEVKRARVAAAIDIQRRKGTLRSVIDVCASFGGSLALQEGWQMTPPGTPHTFSLQLTLSGSDGEAATADFVDDVIAEITRTKPARSHFTFTQASTLSARIGMVAVVRPCLFARLHLAEAV